MKRGKNGFTLIELLVVISIIGILSSIVLAALSGARNKSYNGSIQEQTLQLRNHLAEDVLTDGSYPDFATCTSSCSVFDTLSNSDSQGLNIQNAILSINKGATPPIAGVTSWPSYTYGLLYFVAYNANNEVTSFAIFATYQSTGAFGSSGYYCADSSGKTTYGSSISSYTYLTFLHNSTGIGVCF